VFGSGDVFTAEDAVRMLNETNVNVVWIARGAIGNPWIFRQAAAILRGEPEAEAPTIAEQREALAEHFGAAMEIHGEQLAGRRMRKMGIKYSRFHPSAAEVKKDFIAVHSLRDWSNVLGKWYAGDGAGVWPAASSADEVNEEAAV
jgi:tRNA-dihydrouridine synthase